MKQKISKTFAVLTLAAPGLALAHHSGEADPVRQLLHAGFDPLHLSLLLAVSAGLYGLFRLARRSRSQR